MTKINTTSSGKDALEAHSPGANEHRQNNLYGSDAAGHLAVESARYLDAQQDIRTAHDAMCLADASEMMKINRQKIRDDYTSAQNEMGRVSNMGDEDDDTNIHVGNATYHVSSQDTSQSTSGYTKAVWPLVIAAALAAGVPPTVFSGILMMRGGQEEGPRVEYHQSGEKDTDSRNTLRPYTPRIEGE